MRKVIAILTVLVFAFSLLPVEVMAQDAGRAQRIKAKIREHQEAVKRLKGELHQVVGPPPAREVAHDDAGTVIEPALRGEGEFPPEKRDVIRKQKRLEEKRHQRTSDEVKKTPIKRGGGKKEPARRGGGRGGR